MNLLTATALGVGIASIAAPAIAPLVMILENFLGKAWKFLYSVPFVTQEIGGDGEFALLGFLFTSVPFRNLGTERYSLSRMFVRPLGEIISVWFRSMDAHWRWARYRGRPVLFLPGGEGGLPRLVYLRGSLNFLQLLADAAAFHHEAIKARDGRRRRFRVIRYSDGRATAQAERQANEVAKAAPPADGPGLPTLIPVGWREEDLGMSMEGAHLSDLSMTLEMDQIVRDVRFWHAKEEWYRERGISWRRGFLLHGPPGAGKCLGRGTPVLMFDGSIKPVEQVIYGDLLMGPDSKPRKVLGTTTGQETMYRVTPVKGEPYTVNESHILSLKLNGEVVNLSVRDWLRAGSYFQQRAKGWRTGVDFTASSSKLPMDPYLLGVWLGDGTASKTEVTTADPEIEIFLRQQASIMSLSLTGGYVTGQAKSWSFSTGDLGGKGQPRDTRNPMSHALRGLNVWKNKHVPHIYKTASRVDRLQILAGLIDTDGHLMGNGGYEIVQKNRQLADDISYLARSLGMAAYIARKEAVCSNSPTQARGVYWRVGISGDVSVIPVRIPRKRSPARLQIKDVLVTGISVESIGFGDYYGFELDHDGLFLLGDFTVTHNTSIVRALAEDLDLPVCQFELAGMDNAGFVHAWNSSRHCGSRIVLFEDFDTVFKGRTNISQSKEGGLTFDTILNSLDGIEREDGLLFFVTTNHVDDIDPALGVPDGSTGRSTRPGRIDVTVAFQPLGHAGRVKIAMRILRDEALAEELAVTGAHDSPAQLTERCVAYAMDLLERERRATGDAAPVDPRTDSPRARTTDVLDVNVNYDYIIDGGPSGSADMGPE